MRKKIERILLSTLGMTLINVGVGFAVNAAFGSDCLTLAMEACQHTWGRTVGTYNTVFGVIMLIIALLCDKKKVGYATAYYVVAGQYIIDGTMAILPVATNIFVKLLYVAIAILVISFGSAFGNCARLGLSFYDAFTYSVTDRFNINYIKFRYIVEAVFLIFSIILKTYPSYGTIIYFVCLGPCVTFILSKIKKPIRKYFNLPYEQ